MHVFSISPPFLARWRALNTGLPLERYCRVKRSPTFTRSWPPIMQRNDRWCVWRGPPTARKVLSCIKYSERWGEGNFPPGKVHSSCKNALAMLYVSTRTLGSARPTQIILNVALPEMKCCTNVDGVIVNVLCGHTEFLERCWAFK